MNALTIDLAPAQGRALYHDIWQTLRDNFWDPTRIAWSDWEHRFDHEIDGVGTAKAKAGQLIRALQDNYTKLLEKSADDGDDEELVFSEVLSNNIGYLRIVSFSASNMFEQVSKALESIANCDAYIIDLRDNGGGFLNPTARCLELFIEKGAIATIEEQVAGGVKKNEIYFDEDTFYRFVINPDGSKKPPVLAHRATCRTKGKPIVLLVNRRTASSAEFFAAAMLANGESDGSCIAMGEETFGKGITQTTVEFDECSLKFTSGRYLAPDDRWFGDGGQTVAKGLRPTVRVNTANFKEPVRAAYQHLLQKLGRQTPSQTPQRGGGWGLGLALGAGALLVIGAALTSRRG